MCSSFLLQTACVVQLEAMARQLKASAQTPEYEFLRNHARLNGWAMEDANFAFPSGLFPAESKVALVLTFFALTYCSRPSPLGCTDSSASRRLRTTRCPRSA